MAVEGRPPGRSRSPCARDREGRQGAGRSGTGPVRLRDPGSQRTRPDRPNEDSSGPFRRHRRDTVQSPLETYLREINEMALLTADEEKDAGPPDRAGRQEGPRPDGPGEPPAGGQHRPRLRRQGPGPSGPDRGGEPRTAAGRRGVRPAVDPVQHLRQLLDQAVDQAGAGQHGQADPHSRLHGRAAFQVAADGRATCKRRSAGRRRIEEIARTSTCPRRSWRSSRRRSRSTTSCRRPTSPRTAGASARCSWTSGPGRRTSRWSRPTTCGWS